MRESIDGHKWLNTIFYPLPLIRGLGTMSNATELLSLPWLITEIFGILIVINGFLIAKYFGRFETFTKAVTNLDKTIALLHEKLLHLQTNDHEKTKAIGHLAKKISKIAMAVVKLRTSVESCQSLNTCLHKDKHNDA
jgi:hypothetical protein